MRNKNAKVSDPKKFITSSGAKYHIEYDGSVDKEGNITLKEVGKTDIKASINSYKETTDIDYIRKKIEMGDLSGINQSKPSFGDFTQMPKTMAEALQMQIDAKRAFMKLDIDTRNKFDNDVNKFLVSAGSEEWLKKLGITPVINNEKITADLDKVSEVDNNVP